MIVVLDPNEPPRLTDLDRFDRLQAEAHGPLDDARLDDLCERADDEHVWLHWIAPGRSVSARRSTRRSARGSTR